VLFVVHRFLSPWWRRPKVPPKRRFLQEPHGVTSQKTPFETVSPSFLCQTTQGVPIGSHVSHSTHDFLWTFPVGHSKTTRLYNALKVCEYWPVWEVEELEGKVTVKSLWTWLWLQQTETCYMQMYVRDIPARQVQTTTQTNTCTQGQRNKNTK
jgi:hypothetical protein